MGYMSAPPVSPPTAEQVTAALAGVQDPEIRRPITDLGMVKSVDVGPEGEVRVEVYLTVAGCPLRDTITKFIEDNWGLPRISGSFDAIAGSLDNMFNFGRSGGRTKPLFLDPTTGQPF